MITDLKYAFRTTAKSPAFTPCRHRPSGARQRREHCNLLRQAGARHHAKMPLLRHDPHQSILATDGVSQLSFTHAR